MAGASWRLILNGKACSNEQLRQAVQALRDQGQGLDVRVIWEAGDEVRCIAEALADGVQVVIAGGGDGTLSYVAQALVATGLPAAQLPALALLPLGTANDFAAACGIADEPLPALQLIADSTPVAIDLLRIDADGQQRWCANLASGGFGTDVTVQTPDGMKKLLGGLAYLLTGIAKLGSIEAQQATLRGPAFEWSGQFIALALGNGRQAGGGQQLCPQAMLDDGLLALSIIPPLGNELPAKLGLLLAEGKQGFLDEVAVQTSLPWLEIHSEQPLTLNLDGEPLIARHFRVECVPARIRMHLPADCALLMPP